MRMLKIYANLICKILAIFNDFLNQGRFPSEWKEANVVLVHKKGYKQSLAITLDIFKSLDDGSDVAGSFLDISKAFDKVWDKGLLLKLNETFT